MDRAARASSGCTLVYTLGVLPLPAPFPLSTIKEERLGRPLGAYPWLHWDGSSFSGTIGHHRAPSGTVRLRGG
jgi:hypothetical protein